MEAMSGGGRYLEEFLDRSASVPSSGRMGGWKLVKGAEFRHATVLHGRTASQCRECQRVLSRPDNCREEPVRGDRRPRSVHGRTDRSGGKRSVPDYFFFVLSFSRRFFERSCLAIFTACFQAFSASFGFF